MFFLFFVDQVIVLTCIFNFMLKGSLSYVNSDCSVTNCSVCDIVNCDYVKIKR